MYKFLNLMSNAEFKAMLINYGNNTGAEINNYVIRQLNEKRKNLTEHLLLDKMESHIKDHAISVVCREIQSALGRSDFNISDNELISVIRENKNNIYFQNALNIESGFFDGICKHHGHSIFKCKTLNKQKSYYYCSTCFDDGENKIIYNPIRNLIMSLFIKLNGITPSMVAKEIKITDQKISRYLNNAASVPDEVWVKFCNLIKQVRENAAAN